MKKLAFLMFSMSALALISSCGDDEELSGPTPTVAFEIDKEIAEPGDEISFINNTVDGVTYVWDFGDNETSTQENPKHEYSETGDYTITLTAKGSGGKESSTSSTITIGTRWILGFEVLKINPKNSEGNDWDDDGTPPDFVFFLGKATESTITTVTLERDILLEDIPFGVNITGGSLELTDEDWNIGLFDNDEPFETLTENDSEIMFFNRVNPTEVGQVDNSTGQGSFLISDGSGESEINVRFELRKQ